MNTERSESTKRGIRAEALVRQAVGGRKGACDVHTVNGGFEVRWGPTTKNHAGLNADRKRVAAFGGYCVQVMGDLSAGQKAKGDRSLLFFLRDHGFTLEEAADTVERIRAEASNGRPVAPDGQTELPL